MVNFRFHLISLVAVFLALGIGILMGSTVIDQATVRQLESNVDRITDQRDAQRRRTDGLTRELTRWGQFADQSRARLLGERLRGVPVLALAIEGVDGGAVDDVHRRLAEATANDQGTLVLTAKLALATDQDVVDLAGVLHTPPISPDVLRRQLLDALTAALRSSGSGLAPSVPSASAAAPQGAALLVALRQAGFLDYQSSPSKSLDLAAMPLASTRLVVLSGAGARVPDTVLAVPLCILLGRDPSAKVVAAEAGSDDPGRRAVFVGLLRQDREAGKRISTVDDLEQFYGQVALVLALEDLASGRIGHFGVAPGVRLLPPA